MKIPKNPNIAIQNQVLSLIKDWYKKLDNTKKISISYSVSQGDKSTLPNIIENNYINIFWKKQYRIDDSTIQKAVSWMSKQKLSF